jgi:hypothetical protein
MKIVNQDWQGITGSRALLVQARTGDALSRGGATHRGTVVCALVLPKTITSFDSARRFTLPLSVP